MIFDDCGRLGERNTAMKLMEILRRHNIQYTVDSYDSGGIKQVLLIASASWK